MIPGGEAGVDVRVRNTGVVVDQFSFEVVGDAAAWATVIPPTLSLFPQGEGSVRVSFRPPRSGDVPAGAVPFGVRVMPQEDPAGVVTEEGVLDIAPFTDVSAELLPRTGRGSRGAAYELAVDNRGNARVNAVVSGGDPDGNVLVAIDPPAVVAEPNTAAFAKVKVKPKKTFRKGPPQTRQYHVLVEPEGQAPTVVQGTLLQEQTVPRWIRRAVLWSLLGLLLLALLWFGLVRPTVRSEAKDAAEEAVAPPTIAATSGSGAGSGSGGGSGSSGSGSSGESGDAGSAVVTGQGSAIDGRLFLTEKGVTAFEVPAGQTLQLTDIVLQNPNGESGQLQIRRDGNPLLVVELSNFRDLDYHFVAPIVFSPGQKLELSADCTSPTCTPGAYFAGFIGRTVTASG